MRGAFSNQKNGRKRERKRKGEVGRAANKMSRCCVAVLLSARLRTTF